MFHQSEKHRNVRTPGEFRDVPTVSPVRITGTSLGHTDYKCAQEREKIALKPMMGHRKKYLSKFFIRRKSVNFGCPEHKVVSLRHVKKESSSVWFRQKRVSVLTRLSEVLGGGRDEGK